MPCKTCKYLVEVQPFFECHRYPKPHNTNPGYECGEFLALVVEAPAPPVAPPPPPPVPEPEPEKAVEPEPVPQSHATRFKPRRR